MILVMYATGDEKQGYYLESQKEEILIFEDLENVNYNKGVVI